MDFALQYGFRLGTLEVYPLRGEIVGPNGPVHLQPKAMEVLVCLAERPMEVVKRAELLDRVWGRSARQNHHADDNLNRCISELRHQLGDHPSDPHYIQTVPRRGYRLVLPVQLMNGEEAVAVGYDSYFDEGHVSSAVREASPQPSRGGGKTRRADPSRGPVWSMDRLLGEMQRRRVFRVAIGYPVIAWGILEVGDFMVERILAVPEVMQQLIMQLIFAVLAMGYALALYLAWATQLTPEGVMVEPDSRMPGFLRRGPQVWLAAAAGIVALGVLGLWFFGDGHRSETLTAKDCARTIGVLPFENFSPSSKDDYLGRGLAEEVLHLLAQIADLKVASRTAAFSLDTTGLSMPEIGRRLGVCNILEGSVRREGDKLRITAQLIETSNGFHAWSGTFDRQVEDIFNVYDDIAMAVVRAMQIALEEPKQGLLTSRPTKSLDAYDRYLQGMSILAKADDEARVLRADQLFESALEFDPEFARAWAARCDANAQLFEFTRSAKWMVEAEEYCAEALGRDPSLTDVRVALARLMTLAGRYDEAMDQLNTARATDSGNADVWRAFGLVYERQDKKSAAETAFLRAVKLAPGDLRIYQDLGTLYFDHGRLEDSEAIFREMVAASGGSAAAYTGLGSALLLQGRFAESASAYRQAIVNEPNPRTFTNAGTAYFYQGKFRDAAVMMREAVALSPDDYRLVGNLADALMHMPGDEEEALILYRHAADLAEQSLALNPEDVYALSMIAHFYAELGREDDARVAIERAVNLGPEQFYIHYFAGLSWVDLQRYDEALESLRLAVESGYPKKLLAADPHLDQIRNTPEFQAIIGG
ncbi:MAG: tetratricopeptide repeat protein [Gammaproteobacteria bacterium]|jgi:TolB-like protein/DNA-binding winged helix-turn-helix (wHTH) protein/tetratricopeptide (TPR) repeat protein